MVFGVKRFVTFLGGGIYDRARYWVTGKKSRFGWSVARNLTQCEPWTNHYSEKTLSDIQEALKIEDFTSAQGLAAFATKEDADPFCVKLLEDTIELAARGRGPTFELFTLGDISDEL